MKGLGVNPFNGRKDAWGDSQQILEEQARFFALQLHNDQEENIHLGINSICAYFKKKKEAVQAEAEVLSAWHESTAPSLMMPRISGDSFRDSKIEEMANLVTQSKKLNRIDEKMLSLIAKQHALIIKRMK